MINPADVKTTSDKISQGFSKSQDQDIARPSSGLCYLL